MNGPHMITIVRDPSDLDLRQVRAGLHGILLSDVNPLGRSSLFKCKDQTISEVFGYEHVPVVVAK
jgi:hypothetical protein